MKLAEVVMHGIHQRTEADWVAAERFGARTESLIEMFGEEPAGIANVALMASDYLLEQHGVSARWRDLDIAAFTAALPPVFAGIARGIRPALEAFVALAIANEGRPLPEPKGDGIYVTPVGRDGTVSISLPMAAGADERDGRNRSERRLMARLARRAARREKRARGAR